MFGNWISEWTETRRRKLPPPWKLVLLGVGIGLALETTLLLAWAIAASFNL